MKTLGIPPPLLISHVVPWLMLQQVRLVTVFAAVSTLLVDSFQIERPWNIVLHLEKQTIEFS